VEGRSSGHAAAMSLARYRCVDGWLSGHAAAMSD
jgi:hypothetical protein